MLKTTNFLLQGWMKFSTRKNRDHGFTLVELLIGLVMAFLVLTPLFGLMISIMNTDEKEQAKTTSEQELQTAIDFITRDLQKAVYIYDSQGVTNNYNTIAANSGIKDSLPTVTGGVPILVFWKQELVSNVIPTTGSKKDDASVYSLVAYYLINSPSTIWSNTARIARWQIKDGVRSPSDTSGVTCNSSYNTSIKFVDADNCPSPGFKPFDLDMNQWQRSGSFTNDPQVLVDFIDQTPRDQTNVPNITPSCAQDDNQQGVTITPISSTTMTSFYACVSNYADPTNQGQVISTAQIFIRGNALARIQTSNIDYKDKSQQTYFPTVSAIIQARGSSYAQ
ncbi:hormogonium polysaccharide secretion pseudopilin HpsC [Aphanizomenon flos-aquae NRERC-008]|uniref:Prepilin-type N-terminal cleavage/methylation domain-containing protein n=1 Tax=Aphanizomenon flos-aquae FACHB-1249 TaxID=2692889 RepID=A0ABR8ILZ4_APHFL|nr:MULTISPECIES: hormogonium polysaccharide secretion pseudopilin HpsC [Aphanizomenon]MBD2389456.1 prepilin-type N-terminal cleavage/methylation domain-containing protein [Aphanizomenon flos-aquae FACHB-1171]MBD2555930.1 prepilin-type N-terminal cleavage/methylation domain-containing protein [Aphanizomenon flos-aquae FACHB-1290]MBD2632013.1 prepilin-type N-terminal cleavage/methylation domain-containing protein [Aphanizomenon sp. FACHB-1399]MBD2641909.1 prepilin-type N-terminal cleavage/methyla